MRVLLVEDDPAIAEALVDGLPRYGFEVTHVTTAAEALAGFDDAEVVLLDLGLPDADGIEVCRTIRATSDVPLLIITARSDEVERVVGLELGADDYLTKPFGLRELVARIRAVLRRTTAVATPDADGSDAGPSGSPAATTGPIPAAGGTQVQTIGRLRIDRDARRAFVDDDEVSLTPKEFDLLATLASRPGVVLGREDLMNEVWDEHWFGSTRTLDVHVGALRRKLTGALEITTVRGVGFRVEQP
ncbi:response regulator transcription factor [Williamsia sp. CHRR-6]|uniref:response regulator transcription factor n=1 Tax=Williamsia sp. CHRR-6 TaxID=2835871 RepID=UPI001BD9753F|nr:response regulator transcription factor [Williamsia sp. CHRR-6]MBT0567614.1 response regulator transcription factor [Williamsia sp. CHRR-6]